MIELETNLAFLVLSTIKGKMKSSDDWNVLTLTATDYFLEFILIMPSSIFKNAIKCSK